MGFFDRDVRGLFDKTFDLNNDGKIDLLEESLMFGLLSGEFDDTEDTDDDDDF